MRIRGVIDTETTGLNAGVNEIIQLAIVIVDEDFNFVDKFVSKVRPMHEANIEEEAMKVNRLKNLDEAPTPLQVRNAFFQWNEEVHDGAVIEPIGHNYSFDKDFLKIFFGHMYNEKFYYKFRDTFVLAQAMIDRGSLDLGDNGSTSLVGLCDHFEIPIKAHDALGDVLATLQLYKKLLEIV